MRNLLLLFTLVIFSYSSKAQRIALSKTANVDLPKKMVSAQVKDAKSLITQRFSKTKSLSNLVATNLDKTYFVDNMVVMIKSASIPSEPGFLKTYQLAADETGLTINGYSSKIEKIDGKDVFVIDHISEGIKLYRFTTINSTEDQIVTGFVQHQAGDEIKARKLLEEVIKGLKFNKK